MNVSQSADITASRPDRRAVTGEALLVAALLIAGGGIAFTSVREFRAEGNQPRFYQENFGPAVMMACGYGFAAPSAQSTPVSLREFLDLKRNNFDCADLPHPMVVEPVAWNGTWYYLYGATALVWRVAGMTWPALDGLAAIFGAVVLAGYYALFRLVAGRIASVLFALLLMALPANLAQVHALRDYSKAPFVLVSVWILAWLVMRPMRRPATWAMSSAFGAVVGLGYGFRSDLMIMVPFGVAVLAMLLPGSLREVWPRNVGAAGAALLAFLLVGAPPLRGLGTGGCQFHYSLLGLTSPFGRELGLRSPIYAFGDHFLDTFVDQKVGDYGARIMGLQVPNLCAPDYDRASGELFFRLAKTFPADLIARAYGSVLVILRSGMTIPDLSGPLARVWGISTMLAWLHAQSVPTGVLGPLLTACAIGVAWTAAPRLGIALTAFVLFLGGYPAIEFETRHWFHLRFIPWWAALLVVSAMMKRWHAGGDGWRRDVWRGALPVVTTVLVMAGVLGLVRLYQSRAAAALIQSYLAAPEDPLPVSRSSDSSVAVDWQPADVDRPPAHRSADLLMVTIDAAGCKPAGDLDVRIRYDADLVTHDMSSTVTVARATPGSPPTRLFFPIFAQGHLDHTYMRFAAVDVPNRAADCITRVARVADRQALPLWLQIQVPPDWAERPLYQTFQTPRALRFF